MVYLGPLFLFIASVLQAVVLPQVVPISFMPNLVVLLVVAVCLVESLYDAVIWAFIGGLLLDLMTSPALPLGTNALILVLLALLSSLGQANPFHSRLFVPLVTVFAATIFYFLVRMGLAMALGLHQPILDNLIRVALPSAVLNAILMPAAYSLILWLSMKFGRRVTVEW
jgi:rod shape-determining protein MreD